MLVVYNRKYGIRSSGLQFLFWFVFALCGAPQFRTEIRGATNEMPDPYYFYISYLIFYPLVLIMFFLNCFADKAPRESLYPKSDVCLG